MPKTDNAVTAADGAWSRTSEVRSRSWSRLGDLGFEVGEAAVLEPQVLACCPEALVEGPFVGGQLAGALLESGVLDGRPLDGLLGPFRPPGRLARLVLVGDYLGPSLTGFGAATAALESGWS
jgi:hypothetical protein